MMVALMSVNKKALSNLNKNTFLFEEAEKSMFLQ